MGRRDGTEKEREVKNRGDEMKDEESICVCERERGKGRETESKRGREMERDKVARVEGMMGRGRIDGGDEI